jgi:hypothetical protein
VPSLLTELTGSSALTGALPSCPSICR